MIDPRLHVLQVVAQTGTMAGAARALDYTPSAVSHQLRSLSRELGVPLFKPEGRNVRLTPAATLLLRRSDGLFAHWEEIRGELQTAGGVGAGRLSMAGFSTAASALLPPVAIAAMRQFPESLIQIVEADPNECVDMLLSGTVDIAVVVGTGQLPSADDPRFVQQSLMDDTLDLLVPVDHPLAGRRSIRLEEAAEESWILDRPGSPHHELVVSACLEAGFTPRHVHRVVEWDTGAALVAAGFGVALVPRLARVPGVNDLVRVPLRGDPSPVRHVRVLVRGGTSGQPEIALALRELSVVAARVSKPIIAASHADDDHEVDDVPTTPVTRLIESEDVSRLPLIEAAADRLLIDLFGPEAFAGVTPGEARDAAPGFVLVAERPCVGFAQVVETGRAAHLQQLAVDPSHGRRGLGSALVQSCCEEAVRRGHTELTLTTFRDVAFNAPWYARMGFSVVEAPSGVLAQHLEDEQDLARLMPRVAMRRTLDKPHAQVQ
ncbi:GNAT family N-acetyltransferase [Aeromicrobium sp. CF3.5]|uniref:GNAT family N-acetyltransferase n=1 Tax=Aeromicrobium sp. CF3.5 TaxID=3373078 RepID=UPI003EE70EF4